LTGLFESVTSILKTFVDLEPQAIAGPESVPEQESGPKVSSHVGEVMNVWKYLVLNEEAMVIQQIGRNTTTDSDLLELLGKYGAKLKTKMRERGWLKLPPAYHPPGLPGAIMES
jgi:hypothetical protein